MTKQKLAHTHSQLYFVTSSDSDISGPKLKKKRKKKDEHRFESLYSGNA